MQTSTVRLNLTGGGDVGDQCVTDHDLYCGEPPTARPARWVVWRPGEKKPRLPDLGVILPLWATEFNLQVIWLGTL